MNDPLARLLSFFDLERVSDDVFVAPNPGDFSFGRVFGGQVVGQALRAALHTVDSSRRPHSLHAYFIRPGRSGVPIRLEVDRTRDGRSFTTRYVVARQHGEAIYNMACSFHIDEEGNEYQLPPNDAPNPEELVVPEGMWGMGFGGALEMHELPPSEPDERGVYTSTRRCWMRVGERLDDDPGLHACVIAFMSDMGASMGARVPAIMPFPMGGASLDHALWYLRPCRADEWLLMDLHAVSNSGARGLTRGTIHTRHGVLAAAIAQEALLRPTGRMG